MYDPFAYVYDCASVFVRAHTSLQRKVGTYQITISGELLKRVAGME